MNHDPWLQRATGGLLVAGAAVFWGIIIAAIVSAARTGALPFKDPGAVPAEEFYRSLASGQRWWLWIHGSFVTGIVLTALGLGGLRSLLASAGDRFLADLGWALFLLASAVWIVQLTVNVSLVLPAARETAAQGAMPAIAGAWPRWIEMLVLTYMVPAYLALALFGAAILRTGLLPAWAGWTSAIIGIAGALSVVAGGAPVAIPLLIHVVPFILGILLLRR